MLFCRSQRLTKTFLKSWCWWSSDLSLWLHLPKPNHRRCRRSAMERTSNVSARSDYDTTTRRAQQKHTIQPHLKFRNNAYMNYKNSQRALSCCIQLKCMYACQQLYSLFCPPRFSLYYYSPIIQLTF